MFVLRRKFMLKSSNDYFTRKELESKGFSIGAMTGTKIKSLSGTSERGFTVHLTNKMIVCKSLLSHSNGTYGICYLIITKNPIDYDVYDVAGDPVIVTGVSGAYVYQCRSPIDSYLSTKVLIGSKEVNNNENNLVFESTSKSFSDRTCSNRSLKFLNKLIKSFNNLP